MLRGKLVEGKSEDWRDRRGKMCVALDDTSCCFPSTGLILAPIPGAMSPHLQAEWTLFEQILPVVQLCSPIALKHAISLHIATEILRAQSVTWSHTIRRLLLNTSSPLKEARKSIDENAYALQRLRPWFDDRSDMQGEPTCSDVLQKPCPSLLHPSAVPTEQDQSQQNHILYPYHFP